MVKQTRNISAAKVIPMAALAGLAMSTACKEEELSRTDKLVGQWEMVSFGEQTFTGYSIRFDFQRDGDFDFCYEDNYSRYCNLGEWGWRTSEDIIDISFQNEDWNISVDLLQGDNMEGDLTFEDPNYPITATAVFVRVTQ